MFIAVGAPASLAVDRRIDRMLSPPDQGT